MLDADRGLGQFQEESTPGDQYFGASLPARVSASRPARRLAG